MFPYTVKYNESESDIQNNNLLYTIHHKCQNTFERSEHFENKKRNSNEYKNETIFYFVICINCIIHIL